MSASRLGLAAAALVLSAGVQAAPPAHAASNVPVWVGAGFAGSYRSDALPGRHGGNHVAFDFYGAAGTAVKIYAAPKNSAYNNAITAHVIASGPGSNDAARCGYYATVQVRENGNAVGQVTFSHLAQRAALQQVSRWGGFVGHIANLPLNSGAGCYQVSQASGRHTHIEFRNYGHRVACAHNHGAVSVGETRYQGYLGDYGKAALSGNTCPSGI